MENIERKASLAERVERLQASSQLHCSNTGDAGLLPVAAAAAAAAAPADAPQPQQPKRRLPTWLTAPLPLAEPVPVAEERARPKVSIKARIAAADAAAGVPVPLQTGAPSVPATTAAATAAAAAGDKPAATAGNPPRSVHPAAATGGLHGFSAPPGPRISLAARLSRPREFNQPGYQAPASRNSKPAADTTAHAAAASTAAALADTEPPAAVATQQEEAWQQHQQQQAQQRQAVDADVQGDVAAAAAAADAGEAEGLSEPDHPNKASAGALDSLWDSDSDSDRQQAAEEAAPHAQQQQQQPQQQQQQPPQQPPQQQQQEGELTLQQRQQRQMAQLGLKLPGAAEDDGWLRDVFAGAAGSGGGRRQSRRAAAASGGGGRSGGAAGGSGGRSGGSRARSGGGAGSGGGSGGGRRTAPPARQPAADAGQQQQQQHGFSLEPALQLQQDGTAAAAAAEGKGDADVDGGESAEPLVLFDADSGLRLQVPGSINQHLRSYQKQGVQFLFSRYAAGSGGVLCDDMGLGKTVQAISFIAALLGKQGTTQDGLPRSFAAFRRHRQQQRLKQQELVDEDEEEQDAVTDANSAIRWPVLVVCPTSVLDNWMRELNMWGTFKAVKYHGPPAAREAIADEAAGGQYEVILTSYDTLRVDAAAIRDLQPHAVIFDEAHKLKNSKSKQYEAALSLDTKYRYGLSGTIMQNDWDELWAVLDLLCPHCLGEYGGFVQYYSKPIKRGQSSTANNYEVVKGEKRRRQLVEVVQQVALRRTKAIIADQLPRKTDNVVFCQLQPLQYRAYDRTLASPDLQALRMAKSPCDCGSGLKSAECCRSMVPAGEGGVLWPHYHCCDCHAASCNRHRPQGCQEYYESQGYNNPRLRCPYCLMLPAISLLTKISNHLELIRPDPKLQQADERQFEFELSVARMVLGPDADVLGGLLANSSGWLGASDETHCGKMATLKMLLRAWACDYSSHNKVLLFSHSIRCLDLLEAFVQRQGYDYVRLDGTTPQKQRQGICDEFNNRPSIFLLVMSTVAGGLGLNLTAANKVVVFDPSWNPAHDLQAQDRAYRLGQTRDVAVYRLVGTGTLEEAVYKRQIYKQQQSNMVIDGAQEPRYWEGVQGEKEKPGELWGLWNLLRFSGQTVETRDILQAYKGRHRQTVEQQLQEDARRQQLEQQQQRQQQPQAAVQAGAPGEAAAGAAAGAAPGKAFTIVVLDQLVDAAAGGDDASELEGVLFDPDSSKAAGKARSKPKAATRSRKRRSSEDAGGSGDEGPDGFTGGAADAAGAAAGDVGGMVSAEEAWCDEDVLGGILDELLPEEDGLDGPGQQAPQQQQQQEQNKRRRRRHAVLTDSEDDGGSQGTAGRGRAPGSQTAAQAAAAAAGVHGGRVAGSRLTSVPEGEEEGGYGSEGSEGLSEVSTDSAGVSADSAGGLMQPVDPVLMALEEQGAILHVHRHEKVLGKGRQASAARRSRRPETTHLQSQQPVPDKSGNPLRADTLLRRSPAEAYSSCSQAVTAAADAASKEGWGPVASLAVWQGVSVADMAEWLLQQTAEQHKTVMSWYTQDVS